MNIDRSCLHLVHRAETYAHDIFVAEMNSVGITPRQFAILLTVSRGEGLSQMHIAQSTGIDRSTLSEIVGRLHRRGLLQRRRSQEDARAWALDLTSEGQRVLRIAEPIAKRVDQRILESLPVPDRQSFVAALRTIVTALEDTATKGS